MVSRSGRGSFPDADRAPAAICDHFRQENGTYRLYQTFIKALQTCCASELKSPSRTGQSPSQSDRAARMERGESNQAERWTKARR
jgi:hypothetical protein